ncbi:MAG: RDD family protein [Nitrospirae bacterium]|nr:RDD family protein [Nitrospirota bacterium]
MLTAFIWVPLEAIFLSTYGTTPGKWFLRTTVKDFNGNILTFKQALRRSLYVWSWGYGIGFYYATLVGMLFSYLDLKDKGATRWDKDGGFEISHEKICVRRGVLTTFLIFCFSGMTALLSNLISNPRSKSDENVTIAFIGILFIITCGLFMALWFEDDN